MTLVDLPDFSLKFFSASLAASCAICTSFDLTVTVTLGSISCSRPWYQQQIQSEEGSSVSNSGTCKGWTAQSADQTYLENELAQELLVLFLILAMPSSFSRVASKSDCKCCSRVWRIFNRDLLVWLD